VNNKDKMMYPKFLNASCVIVRRRSESLKVFRLNDFLGNKEYLFYVNIQDVLETPSQILERIVTIQMVKQKVI